MTEAGNTYRKWIVTAALAAGVGLGAYGVAGAVTSSTTTKSPSSARAPQFHSNEDPAHEKTESPQREAQENSGQFPFDGRMGDHHGFAGRNDNETVVTGATADKIKAAALSAYPGATISKTEKRADGTYEAELTTKSGQELHVSLDSNFKVLADDGPGMRGPHGYGDWGHHFRGGYGPPAANGNAPSA